MTYKKLGFRADIEGLRAIAVLLVIITHAGVPWLPGGFVGVDVFFVLSGYLITALLIEEERATGRIDLIRFYARRFRRLAPGLLLVLLTTMLFAFLIFAPKTQIEQAPAGISAALWVSNFFYAFSHFDYFGSAAGNSLFLHTWSLGVEEQFYLLWPWILIAVSACGLRRKSEDPNASLRLPLIMGLVCAVTLAACIILTPTYPLITFYMMPLRAWQFALGALIWVWVQPQIQQKTNNAPPWLMQRSNIGLLGWLGLGTILLAAVIYRQDTPYPGWRALLPSLGTALVIAAGAVETGPARLLAMRPMQYIGGLSYSWYLWHWPVLLLGAALPVTQSAPYKLLLVGLSLVLAHVSYYCVERPIRNRDRFLMRPLPILLTLAIAVMIHYQWYRISEQQLKQPDQQHLEAIRTDVAKLYYDKCDMWGSDLVVCLYGEWDAPHTAVLMGDSIGTQWFPAVEKLFVRPGWRLLVMTKAHCPMVDKSIFYARIGREFTECAEWREEAKRYVADELKPDVVILGSSATYGELDEQSWIEGSRTVLPRLAASTKHLYVLRSTPILPVDALDCLSNNSWIMKQFFPKRCEGPAFNAKNEQVYRSLQQVIEGLDNARILDMNDLICPGNVCYAERDGMVIYRDRMHVTASFIATLSHLMGERMGIHVESTD